MSANSPTPLDSSTSYKLSKVKQSGTSAEMAVRAQLHALGHRYRTNNKDLPGSPDIANRTKKWAIFVHGCYWHNHEGCKKATIPKNNRIFWVKKFAANKERDKKVQAALSEKNYQVLVLWECEVRHSSFLRNKLERFFRMFAKEG